MANESVGWGTVSDGHGRIIDRADAAMVLRENREELDWQRLHREIVRHGLEADDGSIWREAFPGEPVSEIG